MTKEQILAEIVKHCCYAPHAEVHVGVLDLGPGDILISGGCRLDMTGSIYIGEWTMIGAGAKILTHDHYHDGREPLLLLQKEKGVKWFDKVIGKDVWIHESIILAQVTNIPDGVVIGAGSVLTKNPEPYGIYAGNPAQLIKYR